MMIILHSCFFVYKLLTCCHCCYFPIEKKKRAYNKLPSAQKEKIKAILFIKDRFSISWEAYHEPTQQDESLARTFLVEGCKAVLDSRCNIQKTPGNRPGAELPLEDLLNQRIEEHLSRTTRDGYE